MGKQLLFIVSIISLILPQLASQSVFSDDHICKLNHISLSESHIAGHKQSFRATPGSEEYDIKYHRLEWRVDPTEFFITGKVSTRFRSNVSTLNRLIFDLHNDLIVDSIKQHGKVLDYARLANHILEVNLDEEILFDQIDSITIWYHGVPNIGGFGAFAQEFYDWGPAIWTLSEPYGARDWWPCKQSLDDKIDSVDVIVTTTEGNVVASNGVLMSETAGADNQVTYHWKHRYPIPAYLIAIAITQYEQFSFLIPLEDNDTLEVLNYVYPDQVEFAKLQLQPTTDLIPLFIELFGPYPFENEKYGHAQFGWGGGMEHQTMSFMGSFGYELQAHELAHQWFGNQVTCGSWQDIWLNEGFATYATGLTYNFTSPDVFWPAWKNAILNNIVSEPDGAVFVDDTTSIPRIFNGRLSYAKGAYVLHMIRGLIGDDAFFESLKSYLNHPDLTYGFARTSDLIEIFETQSDTSLTEFMNDWFYGEGYPSFDVQVLEGFGGDSVLVTVSQTQSDSSVSFFETQLPIRFLGFNTDEDTTITFNHIEQEQWQYVQIPFEVADVQIDPERSIISANNTFDIAIVVSTEDFLTPDRTIQLKSHLVSNHLEFIHPESKPVSIPVSIHQANGVLVQTHRINDSSLSIDVSHLPSGIYFVKCHLRGLPQVLRFVKI